MARRGWRHARDGHARLTARGKLLLALGLALLGVVLLRLLVFPPKLSYLGAETTSIDGIPLYTDFLEEDRRGRTGETRRIRWLVIHETGNSARGADAASHNRYLHSEEQKDVPLSWHYTVDDHQIYHHLPDEERGYHAGDSGVRGGGNDCGIGIEICVNEDGDFAKAVDNTAHLAAELLRRYHLDLDDVKQHGDFADKNCPEHLREGDHYQRFLEAVEGYL